MKILTVAAYFSLFLISLWSYSSEGAPKTDEDYAVLPPYCKFAQLAPLHSDPSAKMWSERLGVGFSHVHHYCWGLFELYNARKILDNKVNKDFILHDAIGNMQYVQREAPPTFILQPRISYDIGQIREELGDNAGAMQAYYQCIKLNPKIARPYAALSDLFRKQNNTKEALAILEQGLKYKPKSKALLKRLALLSKDK